MAEFNKWLRRELQSAGVSGGTVARVEIAMAREWGGQRPYLGKIDESRRDQTRAMIRAGVPPSTARRKTAR